MDGMVKQIDEFSLIFEGNFFFFFFGPLFWFVAAKANGYDLFIN